MTEQQGQLDVDSLDSTRREMFWAEFPFPLDRYEALGNGGYRLKPLPPAE